MKKAMQIPAFFVIYSLVWGFMIAVNDWNILIRCIIGLTARGRFLLWPVFPACLLP